MIFILENFDTNSKGYFKPEKLINIAVLVQIQLRLRLGIANSII